MPTARIPLVGSFINRNPDPDTSTKDQKFTNCYPELVMNPITSTPRIFLNKRPGLTASADVQASATARAGSVIWTGSATPRTVFGYLKASGTSTGVYDDAASQVGGDISGTDQVYYLAETMISTTPNLTGVFRDITTPNEAWFFPEGGAWTQVTDGDFPSAVQPPHCHMDGYWFVMDRSGKIYNSDLNSLSAWSATSFIAAQSMPDQGVGVVRYKNYVVALGDASIEFFVNAGVTIGSPLARVPNMMQRVGCRKQQGNSGKPVLSIGDTIYWIGFLADSGSGGVFRLNGGTAEKISTTPIDRIVSMGSGASNGITGIAGAFTAHGMTHIAFTSQNTSTLVHCYCIDNKFWWILEFADSLDIAAVSGANANGASPISKAFFTMESNAKIYTMNSDSPVWTDNSSAYTMTVQTENMDFSSDKRKFWEKIRIVGDRQASTSALTVSFSDDDFVNFSTTRSVDLSTAFNQLTRLGSSRRRSWKLAHAAATPCRLEAIEVDYEVGQT